MEILNTCVGYKDLKNKLDTETLEKIDRVLVNYYDYADKNDDGEKDIIEEYCSKYGNDYVIDWLHGIYTTDELLEFILEENYEIKDV